MFEVILVAANSNICEISIKDFANTVKHKLYRRNITKTKKRFFLPVYFSVCTGALSFKCQQYKQP